jgi:hypothetical protein
MVLLCITNARDTTQANSTIEIFKTEGIQKQKISLKSNANNMHSRNIFFKLNAIYI